MCWCFIHYWRGSRLTPVLISVTAVLISTVRLQLMLLYRTDQRSAQFPKLIFISVVSYMFRTSWIHPQGDSYICSMACFICISVSRLESRTHSSIHQYAHTDACETYHYAYTTVSLRMNPRVSKHVGDNRS